MESVEKEFLLPAVTDPLLLGNIKMNKGLIIIIVIALVGVGGFLVFRGRLQDTTSSSEEQVNRTSNQAEVSGDFVKGTIAPDA